VIEGEVCAHKPWEGAVCGRPAVGYVVTRWNGRQTPFCREHLDSCKLTARMFADYEWDVIEEDGTRTAYNTAPPPADPDPVWESTLDKKYRAEVRRTGTGTAELVLIDLTDDNRELVRWAVTLAYGAQFGPDVQDVADWQEKIEGFIDRGER